MRHGTGPVDVYFEARAELGEGPVWDAERCELLWVDIVRCEIHTLSDDGVHNVVVLPESVGSAVPLRVGEGWIVGLRSGVAIVSRSGEILRYQPIDAERLDHRMNDGACDSNGRFWTGTMHEGEGPASDALFVVDRDLMPRRRVNDVGLSNGIAWSPDDRVMYHVDSRAGCVYSYPFDAVTADLGPRHEFATIPPEDGEPDGVAIDSEGGVWVAIWDGWCVHRYRPTGELDQVLTLPVARATSCAFGGRDRSTMFITTAAAPTDDLSHRPQPSAGHVLRVTVPFAGIPTHAFG
jgi:sugar lactone lactonase YvrE